VKLQLIMENDDTWIKSKATLMNLYIFLAKKSLTYSHSTWKECLWGILFFVPYLKREKENISELLQRIPTPPFFLFKILLLTYYAFNFIFLVYLFLPSLIVINVRILCCQKVSKYIDWNFRLRLLFYNFLLVFNF
jgi:hypothetical protein